MVDGIANAGCLIAILLEVKREVNFFASGQCRAHSKVDRPILIVPSNAIAQISRS